MHLINWSSAWPAKEERWALIKKQLFMLISPLFDSEKERRIIKKWKAQTNKVRTLRESEINPNATSQRVQGSVSMLNDKPDDSLEASVRGTWQQSFGVHRCVWANQEISAVLRLIYQQCVCTSLCFQTFHSNVCDLSTFVPELVCTSLTNAVVRLTVHPRAWLHLDILPWTLKNTSTTTFNNNYIYYCFLVIFNSFPKHQKPHIINFFSLILNGQALTFIHRTVFFHLSGAGSQGRHQEGLFWSHRTWAPWVI